MKTDDIIIVQSEDGILHEMIVKSVDQNNRTVTGEIAFWKDDPRARFSGAPDLKPTRIVQTITVPDHSIVEGK